MRTEQYVSGVETERTIIFNSRLDGLLIKNQKEGKSISDIRSKDSRYFHELLGVYCGDLKEKNRIYNLNYYSEAALLVYCLEAWVLTPEIGLDRFEEREPALIKELSSYGDVRSYKSSMRHGETSLDHFSDGHPLAFKKTRLCRAVHLSKGAEFKKDLEDYFLIGNGYANRKNAIFFEVPEVKGKYKGPFLRMIIRGALANRSKHKEIVEKSLDLIL